MDSASESTECDRALTSCSSYARDGNFGEGMCPLRSGSSAPRCYPSRDIGEYYRLRCPRKCKPDCVFRVARSPREKGCPSDRPPTIFTSEDARLTESAYHLTTSWGGTASRGRLMVRSRDCGYRSFGGRRSCRLKNTDRRASKLARVTNAGITTASAAERSAYE